MPRDRRTNGRRGTGARPSLRRALAHAEEGLAVPVGVRLETVHQMGPAEVQELVQSVAGDMVTHTLQQLTSLLQHKAEGDDEENERAVAALEWMLEFVGEDDEPPTEEWDHLALLLRDAANLAILEGVVLGGLMVIEARVQSRHSNRVRPGR
jgi:hypothetical protein